MAKKQSTSLPDYEHPPVIEVVYGMQFASLIELRTPLIGLLWQNIKSDYPKFQEMPVLAQVLERFDQEAKTETASLELLEGPPLPRVFFLDANENWVMQIQNDRFLHNWKRVKEGDVYPRFNAVSEKFFEAWEKFSQFCRSESVSAPKLNQLELTYINHIPVREGKSVLEEIESVFPDMRWHREHEFLPDPESLSWKTSFLLPNGQGRLHVSLRHALRRKEKTPVLLLELTARGMPSTTDLSKVKDWFSLGREWIVRGFSDLTDAHVQRELWGRKG